MASFQGETRRRKLYQAAAVSAVVARLGLSLRTAVVAVLVSVFVSACASQSLSTSIEEYSVYGEIAPGSEHWDYPEIVHDYEYGQIIFNTREPTMRVFLPPKDRANGGALILLPGGALRQLSFGSETDAITEAFVARGFAVITMTYRTRQIPPEQVREIIRSLSPPAPFPSDFPKLEIRNANANPAPNDAVLDNVLALAISDLHVATEQVLVNAGRWGIDPNRIGLLGISAGGGVAVGSVIDERAGLQPAFVILVYGPSLQDVVVPDNAPALFMVTEANHGPVTDGLLALLSVWTDAGKAAELHVFDVPLLPEQPSLWLNRAFDWIAETQALVR